MNDTTLNTDFQPEEKFNHQDANNLTAALLNYLVGRDSQGRATPLTDIGSPTIPFGRGYINELIQNGKVIDFAQITADKNRIVSGKTTSESSKANFANVGGAASLTAEILGASVSLSLVINGAAVSIVNDITQAIPAGFAVNDEATINDTGIDASGTNGKYVGEPDYVYGDGKHGYITVTAAQSEITSRIGQYSFFSFSQDQTQEVFLGYIASATRIEPVRRRSSFHRGSAVTYEHNLKNGEKLKIMKSSWAFIYKNNHNQIEWSHRSPHVDETSPASAVIGDTWYRNSTGRYYRYDGSVWGLIEAIPVAIYGCTPLGCVAYQCLDFYRNSTIENNVETRISAPDTISLVDRNLRINVAGERGTINHSNLEWKIPRDLAAGAIKDNDTWYYCYVTDDWRKKLDKYRPSHRSDLNGGKYHPFENWKCVAEYKTDASGNFVELENYRPWQRYNPRGRIPTEYPIKFSTIKNSSNRNQGKIEKFISESEFPIAAHQPHPSSTIQSLTFKKGFFTSKLFLKSGICTKGGTTLSGDYSGEGKFDGYSPSGLVNIGTAQGPGGYQDSTGIVVLMFGGNQLIQTNLDNRLK